MRFEPKSSLLFCVFCFFFLNGFIGLPIRPATIEPDDKILLRQRKVIYRIEPERRGGEGFKLVYIVPVPVDVFWRFKTDFKGEFLLSNRYIMKHRFVRETDNITITENRYSNAPNETFRWRTISHADRYRLEFELENPRECGQKFNYGTIHIEPFGSYTKVTHICYFDFFGASLWVNLPFEGGMSTFLAYIARWEQETVMRLRDRYAVEPAQ
jgi:hypothetical protein